MNALNQVVGVEKRHWPVSSPNNVDVSNTAISYNARGNAVQITEGAKSTTINYDAFDMVISTISGSEMSINDYDYRGRRLLHGFRNSNTDYETSYTYADGTSVAQTKLDLNDTSEKTTLFYRGSDQGGGVGGINYSEFSDGTDLNYKFYNLRGDVIMTIDANDVRKSKYLYFGFGKNELERGSEIETDKHRANTKVEDENNFLNEGKRFRHLELDVFLTPDPLEYVDGFNPYIYCSQNPWGKWDPLGLTWKVFNFKNSPSIGSRPNAGGRDYGNGIKGVWMAFEGSSDFVFESIKNKFIACEVYIYYKNSQGEELNDTILVARELTEEDVVKTKDGFRVNKTKLKAFAQDGGNIVEIMKNYDGSESGGENYQVLSTAVRPGLFEGDLKDKKLGFKESEVVFADWDDKGSDWNGTPQNQKKDMSTAYAQSPIGNKKAFIPEENKNAPKRLEDINAKPLDIAPEKSIPQKVEDYY